MGRESTYAREETTLKRILLVEDDTDVRLVLEHVLLGAGYAIDSVSSVAESRALLGTRSYDLVLADGKLGDGTGMEVVDLGAVQGARGLIVTGYALQFRAEELSRHTYLLKPVRPPELINAVARLIGPADTASPGLN